MAAIPRAGRAGRAAAGAAMALLAACGGGPSFPEAREGALVEVARSPTVWTGVAVSAKGRVFVCHPRWFGPHEDSVVEILPGGRRRPFPDVGSNRWSAGAPVPTPAEAWVCVQALRCVGDTLYVLDAGNPAFAGIVGPAAKLVAFDVSAAARPVGRWPFVVPAVVRTSYLNDVRVDESTRTAYLSDSAHGAIVVLDLATGEARRVLDDHPSTKAEPDVVPVVEGVRVVRPGTGPEEPARIHVDAIALDRSGEHLLWQALCGRTLWRAPTALLRDPSVPRERLAAAVERVGDVVPAEGFETGPDGTLYATAVEEGAVVAIRPDGRREVVVRDPRLSWPDSLALGPGGVLWVTTSQVHRTRLVRGNAGMPRTPCLLLATRVSAGASGP